MIVVGRFIKVKVLNSTAKTTDTVTFETPLPNFHPDRNYASIQPSFLNPFRGFRNSTRPPPIFQFDEDDHFQNSTDDAPPERLTADYVEMGILLVMVLIGGPLNFLSLFRSLKSDPPFRLMTFLRICKQWQAQNNGKSSRRSFDLKIHLTVANLLIIWVYALSDFMWLATYSWKGGDFMCRVVRFVHAFCFYATSNLVSTIAIQRLNVAMKLERPASRRRNNGGQTGRSGGNRGLSGDPMAKLAYGAWALAFLCSVPQLFIWKTFELYPGWQQCVTTWTIERYLKEKEGGSEEEKDEGDETVEFQEKIYNGLHLAFVFWLPVLIIFVCYVLIVTKFHRKIRKQAMQIAAEATAEAETRVASVRASLVLGGPVDAGSPLLLPIAVYRALQYQSIEGSNSGRRASTPQNRRTVPLRRQRPRKFLCLPCCNRRNRYRPTGRVEALPTDEDWDQSGAATASILNASLIGGGRPYLRKSFAIATLSRAKKRTMKKTIWILLSYLICWSPYNVLVLWRFLDRNVDLYDFEIMYNLIVLNAVVNPLIYGI